MRFTTLLKWLFLTPLGLAGLVMLVLLPFIVLIKGATLAYFAGMSPFVSLAAGTFAVSIVLVIYLIAIDKGFNRRRHLKFNTKLWIAISVVFVFNGYALFVLNKENVKDQQIAKEYNDVHPILRLGVRIWSIFDPSLVITDMSRSARDYRRMRLRTNRRSLHFEQLHDRYVHAIDLRTTGRTEFRNWTTNVVMVMMGFKTLRHVGTADHLHVELPLRRKDKLEIAALLRKQQRIVKNSRRKRLQQRRRARLRERRIMHNRLAEARRNTLRKRHVAGRPLVGTSGVRRQRDVPSGPAPRQSEAGTPPVVPTNSSRQPVVPAPQDRFKLSDGSAGSTTNN